MSDPVTEFFSRLHQQHLKERGYKKTRHTFSREMDGYIERIQFQGSAWNDSATQWTFYINYGVEFCDLPARTPCRDFPGTHCWIRLEDIVSGLPKQHQLPKSNAEKFAAKLASCLDRASEVVSQSIDRIRSNYEQCGSPQLALNDIR
jgi:hypothetical protein